MISSNGPKELFWIESCINNFNLVQFTSWMQYVEGAFDTFPNSQTKEKTSHDVLNSSSSGRM